MEWREVLEWSKLGLYLLTLAAILALWVGQAWYAGDWRCLFMTCDILLRAEGQ